MVALRWRGWRRVTGPKGPAGLIAWLRAQIRSSELWLVFVSVWVGAIAGAIAVALGVIAHSIQEVLFGIGPAVRLSVAPPISAARLLVIPAGGLVLGLLGWLWAKRRPAPPVDPVEANALRGGRMSIQDSLFVALQTVLSNGAGASVGLEAAYTQMGGAVASRLGVWLSLRRADLRLLVGAGAGAAIAAAFGAPLTGAFYAFEVVIGAYTVAGVAPVAAAALAGGLVARASGEGVYGMAPAAFGVEQTFATYGLYAGLGLLCAVFGIAVMRLAALVEGLASRLPVPRWLRPAIGGVLLIGLALYSPQTLSSGHGALRYDLTVAPALQIVIVLLLLKAAASIVSLGFGFRGGLFFASLFLGSLLGRAYAGGLDHLPWAHAMLNPTASSLVGMSALAVAVIGGPLTMTFLVLETTGDFGITSAALTASLFASVVVRETFGYSFSTWRLHLRGETIRSAHDVGFLRSLTAETIMRKNRALLPDAVTLAEAKQAFPLGSTKQVLLTRADGSYAGMLRVAALYAEAADPAKSPETVAALAENVTAVLQPGMTIKQIMEAFDRTESDELAVVDPQGMPLGVVSEAYATRRYADELEKARRDLIGEN